MSRKELLQKWSAAGQQDRITAFLQAEQLGKIEEVPGGWLLAWGMFRTNGMAFYEKMPFTGDVLTSFLQMLAYTPD